MKALYVAPQTNIDPLRQLFLLPAKSLAAAEAAAAIVFMIAIDRDDQ